MQLNPAEPVGNWRVISPTSYRTASWRTEAQLGNNGTDYSHAFAILRLNELDPSAEYYEVPIGGTAKLLYVERT